MGYKIMIELVALAEFESQPYLLFSHDYLVESCDMRVDELTVVVDLSCKVRIVFGGGFEDDFRAVRESMSREIDLSERALPYDAPECIVADMPQVWGAKFSVLLSEVVVPAIGLNHLLEEFGV